MERPSKGVIEGSGDKTGWDGMGWGGERVGLGGVGLFVYCSLVLVSVRGRPAQQSPTPWKHTRSGTER